MCCRKEFLTATINRKMHIYSHLGEYMEGISGPVIDFKAHKYLKDKECNLY